MSIQSNQTSEDTQQVLTALQKKWHTMVQAELDQALNRLKDLPENEQVILEALAYRIVDRILNSTTQAMQSSTNVDEEILQQIACQLFEIREIT